MTFEKGLRWARWGFAAVSVIGGIYFMLANYWTWIVHLGGVVWLVLGVVMLIALGARAKRVYALSCLLAAVLQLPIICCYLMFSWIEPTFMGFTFRPGMWGVLFHCCILAAAVALAVEHFKRPQAEGRP